MGRTPAASENAFHTIRVSTKVTYRRVVHLYCVGHGRQYFYMVAFCEGPMQADFFRHQADIWQEAAG